MCVRALILKVVDQIERIVSYSGGLSLSGYCFLI